MLFLISTQLSLTLELWKSWQEQNIPTSIAVVLAHRWSWNMKEFHTSIFSREHLSSPGASAALFYKAVKGMRGKHFEIIEK